MAKLRFTNTLKKGEKNDISVNTETKKFISLVELFGYLSISSYLNTKICNENYSSSSYTINEIRYYTNKMWIFLLRLVINNAMYLNFQRIRSPFHLF